MDVVPTKKFVSRDEIINSLKTDRNLAGADMSNLDLSGIKLMGLSLKGADLHNSNLSKATLAGADLSHVNLANAHLEDARIAGANMESANLRGAHMNAAKIVGVNLHEADLTGADISQSRLVGVNVAAADFSDVKTVGAQTAVKWEDAKVQPDVLPDPIPMPPRWLPIAAIGALSFAILLTKLARRQRYPK